MQNNISLISRGGETKTRHAARVFRKRIQSPMNEVTRQTALHSNKSSAHRAGGLPPPARALPFPCAQPSARCPQPSPNRPGQARCQARSPQGTTRAGRGRTALQAQPKRPVRETGGATALRPQPAASPPARPRGAHRGIPPRGPPGPSRRAAASKGRGTSSPTVRHRPPPSWPPPRTWRWHRPS